MNDMDALYGPLRRSTHHRRRRGRPRPEGLSPGHARRDAAEYVAQPIAAFDVTFSPSKSVSALWAAHPSGVVRQAVLDAHEAAVDGALGYLQDNAGHTVPVPAVCSASTRNGFIIAKFRHRTARSTDPAARVGDPQLHSHCAILNRVHGARRGVAHRRLEGDLPPRPRRRRALRRRARAGASDPPGRRLDRTGSDARLPMREIPGVPGEVLRVRRRDVVR